LRYNRLVPLTRTSLCAAVAALALGAGCDPTVVFATEEPWAAASDWPGVGDGLILVTNSGDDSLSFLDPDTLEPVYRAPTGRIPAEREGPHHGAATPDGRHYFVGISNFVPGGGSGPHGSHGNGTVDGYLLRYDTATNSPAGEVRVGRSPGDVRITPDGRHVLQSHFDLASILEAVTKGEDPRALRSPLAVVEADTMTRLAMVPVCPAGHGISPSPDGTAAYVACWGSDELAIVSLAEPITSEAPVLRVPVGPGGGDPTAPLYGPYAVTVSPDGGEVWVSNLEGKSLVVYQVDAGAFDAGRTVATGGSPLFGAFSADGERLLVPTQAPDALLTVEAATGAVLHTLSLDPADCRAPHGALLLEGGEALALVCEGDHRGPGTVVRVDLSGSVPVLEQAFQVGVYPDDLVHIPGPS
jgi:DNA-binding beta-propeller fold protein YncE